MDPARSKKRARFNLLALEHDEYYFQVVQCISAHLGQQRQGSRGGSRSSSKEERGMTRAGSKNICFRVLTFLVLRSLLEAYGTGCGQTHIATSPPRRQPLDAIQPLLNRELAGDVPRGREALFFVLGICLMLCSRIRTTKPPVAETCSPVAETCSCTCSAGHPVQQLRVVPRGHGLVEVLAK